MLLVLSPLTQAKVKKKMKNWVGLGWVRLTFRFPPRWLNPTVASPCLLSTRKFFRSFPFRDRVIMVCSNNCLKACGIRERRGSLKWRITRTSWPHILTAIQMLLYLLSVESIHWLVRWYFGWRWLWERHTARWRRCTSLDMILLPSWKGNR